MKKPLLLIALLLSAFAGRGQNLVPNGDFEGYSGCPTTHSQFILALPWINPSINPPNGGSPDYFNQCSNPSNAGVPGNIFGFQSAHSGVGYCGIVAGREIVLVDFREYIEVGLTTSLTAGSCFYFEMYISLADYCKYTSDVMGVYFSNSMISGITNYNPLPYTPQININLGFITDTMNWIHITGIYTAAGGENYMLIGNFKDASQTNTTLINAAGIFDYSYFYIDDVSLTPCTGTDNPTQTEAIKIYPNPFTDYFELRILNFEMQKEIEINIIDAYGKSVFKSAIKNPQSAIKITTDHIPNGLYFYEVSNNRGVIKKGKLVK